MKNGAKESDFPASKLPDVSKCFVNDAKGSRYVTYCADGGKGKREEL